MHVSSQLLHVCDGGRVLFALYNDWLTVLIYEKDIKRVSLIATKALGSQVVPVLGTTGSTSTSARYQTASGGAKYRFASGS